MPTRKRAYAVGGLVAVLVLLGAAEAVERHVVTARIESAVKTAIDGRVDVSIGGAPAVIDLVRREVPTTTIRADDAAVCGLSHLRIDSTLRGLRHGSTATVDSTRATVVITPATFTGLVHSVAADLPVTTSIQPATHSVTISLGGLLRISEHVTLAGDALSFQPQDVSVLGQALPASGRTTVFQRLTYTRTLTDLPAGLTPRTLHFAADGISLGLVGGHSRVDSPSRGSDACGGVVTRG